MSFDVALKIFDLRDFGYAYWGHTSYQLYDTAITVKQKLCKSLITHIIQLVVQCCRDCVACPLKYISVNRLCVMHNDYCNNMLGSDKSFLFRKYVIKNLIVKLFVQILISAIPLAVDNI